MQVESRLTLRICESEFQAAFGELWQQVFLLCLVAGLEDQIGTEDDGSEKRLENKAASEAFHNDHSFRRAAADTAVLFRQGDSEPTELGHLFPIIFAIPFAGAGEFATILELVVLAHKTVDAVFE